MQPWDSRCDSGRGGDSLGLLGKQSYQVRGSSGSVSRKELGRKGKLAVQDAVLTEMATVAGSYGAGWRVEAQSIDANTQEGQRFESSSRM